MEKQETSEQATVTISAKEYDDLKLAYEMLSRLEGAGVDNWEGYDEAMSRDSE